MLYVQESLGPGEELVHVGKFSVIYTVQAIFMVIWGMVGSIMVIAAANYAYKHLGWLPTRYCPSDIVDSIPCLHPFIRIGSFGMFALGLITFTQMMIHRMTTEIAITNVRLIYKRGVIARQVGEISIDRIEGVGVLQTILGRMLNYGRLAVRGTGIGEVVLPAIEDPIEFRRAIEKAKALRSSKGKAE